MDKQGKLVGVLNRTNSVSEVYFNIKSQRVNECKHLSQNRTKWYGYDLEEYLKKPLNDSFKAKFKKLAL